MIEAYPILLRLGCLALVGLAIGHYTMRYLFRRSDRWHRERGTGSVDSIGYEDSNPINKREFMEWIMNATIGHRPAIILSLGAVLLVAVISAILFVGSNTGLSLKAQIYYYFGFVLFGIIVGTGLYVDFREVSFDKSFVFSIWLLPLAVLAIWGGLWPAMQYWAYDGTAPIWLYTMQLKGDFNPPVAWWGTQYFKWFGAVVIFFGGYYWIIRKWRI